MLSARVGVWLDGPKVNNTSLPDLERSSATQPGRLDLRAGVAARKPSTSPTTRTSFELQIIAAGRSGAAAAVVRFSANQEKCRGRVDESLLLTDRAGKPHNFGGTRQACNGTMIFRFTTQADVRPRSQ